MATDETRYEASNPQTAPARLQELTGDPDLWPLIAANPSAYDSLVAWLGENGGPEVQSAIASRGSAAAASSAAPPAAPAPQGPGLPPPGGYGQAPSGYAAPGAPQSGSGGSKKGLWITLGVLIFLIVTGGIGTGVWALTRGDDSTTSSDDEKKDSDDTTTTDDDKDDKDDEPTTEVDCDTLDDLEDAAGDLTLYYPDLDDESDLEDAVATIEEFADVDDTTIADAVEVLLAYAEELQDDPDAVFSEAWSDAIDAEYEIVDYVAEEC
ncbi:hypothetical protein [Aeromicrobium sp. Leaf350]|uniref:variant leucine-rich repeat-containing protein n=1 Tax=Aeromicrobium sp. Leaf350 TaxID=2876565 RepID=UPI001E325E8C|nr:hypothetical protein [Aeromicrobium sp. Leaf350]